MNPQTSTYCPKYPGVSGMKMPVLGVFEGVNYPFGFGGQMKDNEPYGDGNAYTAMFWEYDSRLGRRWNVDPEGFESESSYAALYNNPLNVVDPTGLSGTDKKPKRINVAVIPNKHLRKLDRQNTAKENNKSGIRGILYGYLHSAYTSDFIRIQYSRIISLGKLKVIYAENTTEMVQGIIKLCKKGGKIGNLLIDFHRGKLGDDNFNASTISNNKQLSDISKYFDTYSTILLGSCLGGNYNDKNKTMTEELCSKWNGATVIGFRGFANGFTFMFFGRFQGIPLEDLTDAYTRELGYYSISKGNGYPENPWQDTNPYGHNTIHYSINGNIIVKRQDWLKSRSYRKWEINRKP